MDDESKPDRPSDKGAESRIRGVKVRSHSRETHGLREDIDVNTPTRDVKGPKVFERVKEEFEAIAEAIHQRKEDKSQGSPSSVKRDDATFTGSKHVKPSSPGADRRGSPSHHKETHGRGEDIDADIPINEFKGPNIFHRAKEEFEAIVDNIHSKKESDRDAASPKKHSSLADPKGSPRHRRETHGRGEDIDANTPINDFRGPNIFHRAKEEIEAIVDTMHSKKESDNVAPSPKKDGIRASISKKIQRTRNRD
ncbi:hypothetical protein SSX86_032631 [Deinandra increscens subsp. villosa]|uniref:Uncharacterized protein n=1 Tax=Deinandra increscens subsp. villosa TaxID=3103831 RepID=A0AAP0GGP4_9ASTR